MTSGSFAARVGLDVLIRVVMNGRASEHELSLLEKGPWREDEVSEVAILIRRWARSGSFQHFEIVRDCV